MTYEDAKTIVDTFESERAHDLAAEESLTMLPREERVTIAEAYATMWRQPQLIPTSVSVGLVRAVEEITSEPVFAHATTT